MKTRPEGHITKAEKAQREDADKHWQNTQT